MCVFSMEMTLVSACDVSGAALAPVGDDQEKVINSVGITPALDYGKQVIDADGVIIIEIAIAWYFDAR